MITEHEPTSTDLVNLQDHELAQQRLALLAGLSRGERAVYEGRTYSHSEAEAKMSQWPNTMRINP